MARPLREQFIVAVVLVLIPVAAVMTWTYHGTYQDAVTQLQAEAHRLATAVVEHIRAAGPDGDSRNALTAYLAALELPVGSMVLIADTEGTAVATRPRPALYTETILAKVRLDPRGWVITVHLPTQVAYNSASSNVERTVLISGAATLALLLLAAVFLRRWLPALGRLEGAADRVGSGDLSPLPPIDMPSRELEHLHGAFREMVEKLRIARENVESLQQQVIRQERLAAIGVLLSGIAHELNNPLQAISGFSEILQREPDLKPAIKSDLALIQKESARASRIIRNLSRFSRQQSSGAAPVRLGDVVASVIELRQRHLQEQGIQLEVDETATRQAHAVFTELQQVLLNFVINAEHAVSTYSKADRRIIVRTSDTEDGVHFEVEDSGPGVRPEDISKLFQPFFTTKPVGEGTGLGLSVSYGIVRSFGGSIGYARGPLGGARFFVDLPVSQAATA